MGVSDHDIVSFEVTARVELREQPPRTIYMYEKANWDSLRDELQALLEMDATESAGQNVEQLWSKLKVSIMQVVEKHIPHKTMKKRRGRLPWMNQSIRRLIRKRNRLYKLCKTSFSEAKYEKFKSLKRDVQREMRAAHISYTNNLITPGINNHSKILVLH